MTGDQYNKQIEKRDLFWEPTTFISKMKRVWNTLALTTTKRKPFLFRDYVFLTQKIN